MRAEQADFELPGGRVPAADAGDFYGQSLVFVNHCYCLFCDKQRIRRSGMFQYLYEWMQNLAFYMVLATVVLYAVPDSGYKKYIRFFTGMVLILMIITPIFRIFGMDSYVVNFYRSREYEEKIREIEEAADYLKDEDFSEALEEEEGIIRRRNDSIRVEEIQIEGEKEAD